MKKHLFALLLTVFHFPVFSQKCSCEQKFQFIRHEMETNYAGYADKVNRNTKSAYNKLTKETLAKVKEYNNDA